MRTNIEIDDALLGKVMATGKYRTKKAAVEAGLELLAKQASYQSILDLAGTIEWLGPDDEWPGDAERAAAARARSEKQAA